MTTPELTTLDGTSDDGANERVTNLHTAYLSGGGSNCKGCYFGTDLPPMETMFVHWFTSPAFAHGTVKVYSVIDAEIAAADTAAAAAERLWPTIRFLASGAVAVEGGSRADNVESKTARQPGL